jgi:hypothetical protein
MLFSYRDETKELNDLTRKEESGSFNFLMALPITISATPNRKILWC